MDEPRNQPVPPLPLYPWFALLVALGGCVLLGCPPFARPELAWPWDKLAGVAVPFLLLTVYGVGVVRGIGLFFRMRWFMNRRFPITSLAVTGLGLLLLFAIMTNGVLGAMHAIDWRHQDPWPRLVSLVACLAVLELVYRWQSVAIARFRFRLQELLLTAFLVAIVAGAVRYAVVREERSRRYKANQPLLTEMTDMTGAAMWFKASHGIWPPEDPANFDTNVQKVFPNARYWRADLAAAGLDPATMDAEESLVFWLGGMPDPHYSRATVGFASDSTNPLDTEVRARHQDYDFHSSRLTDVDGDGWPEYEAPPRYGSTNPLVHRLQGKEVVVAEYDTRDPDSRPLQIYRNVDGSLEPVAP